MAKESARERQERLKRIGMNIRIERTRQEKALDAFAREISMAKSYYWETEKGRTNPTASTLMRISDGLGVPVAQLLDGV